MQTKAIIQRAQQIDSQTVILTLRAIVLQFTYFFYLLRLNFYIL